MSWQGTAFYHLLISGDIWMSAKIFSSLLGFFWAISCKQTSGTIIGGVSYRRLGGQRANAHTFHIRQYKHVVYNYNFHTIHNPGGIEIIHFYSKLSHGLILSQIPPLSNEGPTVMLEYLIQTCLQQKRVVWRQAY